MRLNHNEIETALSTENEIAEEIRQELQECIRIECDEYEIPLNPEQIQKILESKPDRDLVAIYYSKDQNQSLWDYTHKILKEQGFDNPKFYEL